MRISWVLAAFASAVLAHEGHEAKWIKVEGRGVVPVSGDPLVVPNGAATGSVVLKCLPVKGFLDCPPDITLQSDFGALSQEAKNKQKILGLAPGQLLTSRQAIDSYMGTWNIEIYSGKTLEWRFKPTFYGYRHGGHQGTQAFYNLKEWEEAQAEEERRKRKLDLDLDDSVDPDVMRDLRKIFGDQLGR